MYFPRTPRQIHSLLEIPIPNDGRQTKVDSEFCRHAADQKHEPLSAGRLRLRACPGRAGGAPGERRQLLGNHQTAFKSPGKEFSVGGAAPPVTEAERDVQNLAGDYFEWNSEHFRLPGDAAEDSHEAGDK